MLTLKVHSMHVGAVLDDLWLYLNELRLPHPHPTLARGTASGAAVSTLKQAASLGHRSRQRKTSPAGVCVCVCVWWSG